MMETPVRFMAEVASNHAADLCRCLEFVTTAAAMGCDAVKFQLFRVEKLFAPEILERSAKHRARKSWELPESFLEPISTACRIKGIDFCCTPFDLEAVEALKPYVDSYKIASYELLWEPLLEACAKTGKPVIISTGMADLAECRHAADTLNKAGCSDLTILHCVSHYPALPVEANLACLRTLKNTCGCKTGWSDHSVNPGVIFQAVFGFGATLVEFHLDLDGNGDEFSSGHCWLPQPMSQIIKYAHDGEMASGNGIKTFAESEIRERFWRADPTDGLRPFRQIRKKFAADSE